MKNKRNETCASKEFFDTYKDFSCYLNKHIKSQDCRQCLETKAYRPRNHVRHSGCNRFHLRCKLVPLWKVSICIWQVPYAEYDINVLNVFDKLICSVEWSRLIVTVLIWSITFCLNKGQKYNVIPKTQHDKFIMKLLEKHSELYLDEFPPSNTKKLFYFLKCRKQVVLQ